MAVLETCCQYNNFALAKVWRVDWLRGQVRATISFSSNIGAGTNGSLANSSCGGRTLNLFEYSPNLVKSSVTGFGHADKVSVQKSLQILFKEKINFQTHDESDALAIAYCCAVSSNILKLKNKEIEV